MHPSLTDTYIPPLLFRQSDLHTILPALFRPIATPAFTRERLNTPDNDFLDLDWVKQNNSKVAILSHGLEGGSHSKYIHGMAQALQRRGFDIVCWNFRGCSGEPNRLLSAYHSGLSSDLNCVVQHVAALPYTEIALVGFSVGGNITLKYLGEEPAQVSSKVSRAVAISVPCDLEASAREMARARNFIYMNWFLRLLHKKIRAKATLFGDQIDAQQFYKLRNFYDFDTRYTAPHFKYRSAEEYWRANSSKQFISRIRQPTLILNALDDTFLNALCYPIEEAKLNRNITLEMPRFGGHVGFVDSSLGGEYWSEKRTANFLIKGI